MCKPKTEMVSNYSAVNIVDRRLFSQVLSLIAAPIKTERSAFPYLYNVNSPATSSVIRPLTIVPEIWQVGLQNKGLEELAFRLKELKHKLEHTFPLLKKDHV